MSNLLEQVFKEKALIAYVTLGDPSVEATITYCKALIDAGISMIEIGLPFSDPIADGPIIQASHQQALATGEDVSVNRGFALIKQLKEYAPNVPILIMAATNIIMQYGYQSFFKQANDVNCDGLIMPDCSFEMVQAINQIQQPPNVPLINLVSPVCDTERLKNIVTYSKGFIYLISSTGITGERNEFSNKLKQLVMDIKNIKNIPVAIGFGISQQDHCKRLSQFADGITIGSHFVKLIQEKPSLKEGIDAVCNRVKQFKAVL